MRAFIALEIPEEIKREIGQIQDQLKKSGIQAKWVNSEIIHLTLVFLGLITPDKVKLIEKILEQAVKQSSHINLKLAKISCFPTPAKARVIFIDLTGELGKLHALAIKIRKNLKKEKIWFDEKPLVAHLTLGRIKKRQNLTNLIRKVKIKRVEFLASRITLIKSILTDSGPIYQKLTGKTLKSFSPPFPKKTD